mgnify:FL=1|tara:strand:+ start:395 stop:1018 length:624 start_codon:yes stop_codon:yes gene_type:complete
MSEPKIFVIGFNRTGTTTIHSFFKKNGLPAVHWNGNWMVSQFEQNIALKRPLLQDSYVYKDGEKTNIKYKEITVFSDMTRDWTATDAKDFYKKLDADYPGSKFILNVRDTKSWIRSRRSLHEGAITKQHLKYYKLQDNEQGIEQLKKIWTSIHEQYHSEVLQYFKDRPDDLLVYDITKDGPEKIVRFFDGVYSLNVKHWSHCNRTKK